MNFSRRPSYAKKDANHTELFHDLRKLVNGWEQVTDANGGRYPAYTGAVWGVSFLIVDTSQAGGLALDTRLYIGPTVLDVEIKQKGKRDDLTDGERRYFELTPNTGRVVTCAEEYYALITELI